MIAIPSPGTTLKLRPRYPQSIMLTNEAVKYGPINTHDDQVEDSSAHRALLSYSCVTDSKGQLGIMSLSLRVAVKHNLS